MNKIILSGNLCRDIELNKFNNKSCVHNSIAVQRTYKNADGNYDTDFFNITLWDSKADFIAKYANKGTKILICGRLVNAGYEAEDGTKKLFNEIQVDNIEIISAKKDSQGEASAEEIFGDKLEVQAETGDDLLD